MAAEKLLISLSLFSFLLQRLVLNLRMYLLRFNSPSASSKTFPNGAIKEALTMRQTDEQKDEFIGWHINDAEEMTAQTSVRFY